MRKLEPWTGALVCLLFVLVGTARQMGVIDATVERVLAIALIVGAAVVAMRGRGRLERLSELYLWLSFIVSLSLVQAWAQWLAERTGQDAMAIYRFASIGHVVIVIGALTVLGAWSSEDDENPDSHPLRMAAGLLVVGAVVFWIGAPTFAGMTPEQILENPAGHLWTSATFLLATFITLPALALLTLALRQAGDRFFSVLGLLAFALGAVFWTIHLAFRVTVLTWAAQELKATGAPPPWLQPWREWAGLMFAIYSVLAYLGIAAYGGALLETRVLARWIGRTCVVVGFLAAPLFGPPLIIHVMPWFVGIVLLRQALAARAPTPPHAPVDRISPFAGA
jgi:hypothetical protein